jgi:hypothetical protein
MWGKVTLPAFKELADTGFIRISDGMARNLISDNALELKSKFARPFSFS